MNASKSLSTVFYRLTYGTSEDGKGIPEHAGYVSDPAAARRHLAKIARNPYSFGAVYKVTNGKEELWQPE